MKKILLPGILALAVLLIAGFGMNRSMNSYGDLSDMALKNVLALADGEDPEDPDPGEVDGGQLPPVVITCSASGQGACWVSDFEPLPLGRYRVTCPYFSGQMKDNCMPGTFPI